MSSNFCSPVFFLISSFLTLSFRVIPNSIRWNLCWAASSECFFISMTASGHNAAPYSTRIRAKNKSGSPPKCKHFVPISHGQPLDRISPESVHKCFSYLGWETRKDDLLRRRRWNLTAMKSLQSGVKYIFIRAYARASVVNNAWHESLFTQYRTDWREDPIDQRVSTDHPRSHAS